MSIQVSCPVFRCPKNSIKRCEGYGRACERYICRTHTKGALCDRCVSIKQEDMKSSYKDMMKDLARRAFSAGMKGGAAALFVVALLLIIAAVVFGLMQRSTPGVFPLFVITLVGGLLMLIAAYVWYLYKMREYMRTESLELDQQYPGFYDFYQKWQKVVDDATSYSDL